MKNIIVIGAGKIGSLIACLLADCGDYHVHLADQDFTGDDVKRVISLLPQIRTTCIDVCNENVVQAYLTKHQIVAVISSLPYFLNPYVARAARAANTHYFDLTEDIEVSQIIKELATEATSAFVPQCGLAPGFISIAANSLLQEFDRCHQAKLRVGALPQYASNALLYALTWSTEGIINEYGNPCHAINNGERVNIAPLEDLETIEIDGCEYEAFNTSGGLGRLAELYDNKIQNLNYKTLRYPGHCAKMRFLMNDLKLNDDRQTLKRILENAIPRTYQDIVLLYIAAQGVKGNTFYEKTLVKKIYPQEIKGYTWSAIQISTASSVCAVVDMFLAEKKARSGLVLQENFALNDLLANRFGRCYA